MSFEVNYSLILATTGLYTPFERFQHTLLLADNLSHFHYHSKQSENPTLFVHLLETSADLNLALAYRNQRTETVAHRLFCLTILKRRSRRTATD